MRIKVLALFLIYILAFPTLVFAQSAEEQTTAMSIPAPALKELAKKTLLDLTSAYRRRDVNSFTDHISRRFISSNGLRRMDLEKSIITDFEELYGLVIRFVSFDQLYVKPGYPREVSIIADWDRTTDVQINRRRQRWMFVGRTEFTFRLETDANIKALIKESPEGKIDWSKISWDMKLISLRGDLLFGLTNLNGLIQVVPATGGRQSTLNGVTVRDAIPIGETALLTAVLRNRQATLAAAAPGPQSIDFRTGTIFSGPAPGISSGQGDMDFGVVAGTFTTVGNARIAMVTSTSGNDFNSYSQDIEPSQITIPASNNVIYLVRTRSGNLAKFLVTTPAGATVTIKYAFQPNGSGALASRD